MATRTSTPQATESRPTLYRLTVPQYLTMIDAGVFSDDVRVELLAGVLVPKMTKNDPHDYAVMSLGDRLRNILPANWIVREEKSVVLGRYWRPEPDLAVVRGPSTNYRTSAPRAADIAVIIEVADASYPRDRGLKWRRYAAVRIPIYWIVEVKRKQIEVYTDPEGRGRSASYRNATVYHQGDEVPIRIEGNEIGRIAVNDLMTSTVQD